MRNTENEIMHQYSPKAKKVKKEEKVFIIGVVLFFVMAILGYFAVYQGPAPIIYPTTPWRRWWTENALTIWWIARLLPGVVFVYFVFRLSRFIEVSLPKTILFCLLTLMPFPRWFALVAAGWLTKLLLERHKYDLGEPELRRDVYYKELK